MLWTITIILFILWIVGLVSSYTLGGWIHILLVLAIIVLIFNLLSGQPSALARQISISGWSRNQNTYRIRRTQPMNNENDLRKIRSGSRQSETGVGEAVGNQTDSQTPAPRIRSRASAKETWGNAKDTAADARDNARANTSGTSDSLHNDTTGTGHDLRDSVTSTRRNVKNSISNKLDDLTARSIAPQNRTNRRAGLFRRGATMDPSERAFLFTSAAKRPPRQTRRKLPRSLHSV